MVKKKFKNLKKYWYILLIIGLILRITYWTKWGFGFDQVQILESAKKISQGDFTLIGPRTGPASLFTGPLIYYIAAFFYAVSRNYYSLIYTTIFIAFLTGLFVYFLSKRYLGKDEAFQTLFIWTFSQYLISLDQVTWNPNLTLLSVVLFFFPLWFFIKNNSLNKVDLLFIALGSFLAYQAHFSGFLLLPLALLFLLGKNKIKAIVGIAVSYLSFGISLLPTLLFDLKNNWLNLTGLTSFFNKNLENTQTDPYLIHLWRSFYTSWESLGKIFFSNFSLSIRILFILGLLILIYYCYQLFNSKALKNKAGFFPVLWLFAVILLISFYKGDKPPYYFLIEAPAFLMIYLYLLKKISKSLIAVLAVVFVFLSISLSLSNFFQPGAFSVHNSERIRTYIMQEFPARQANEVVFHLPAGESFGLEYALSDLVDEDKGSGRWYLSYPNQVAFAEKDFAKIQIWFQEEVAADQQIYFNNDFRFKTPVNLSIYRDNYYSVPADQSYVLLLDGKQIGVIEVFGQKKFNQFYHDIDLSAAGMWQIISDSEFYQFYLPSKNVFILKFNSADFYYIKEQIIIL